VGTTGCSFGCEFCQNWEIVHGDPPSVPVKPADLLAIIRQQSSAGCLGIAYTFSEPLVWYEFVLETATLVHQAGYKNVLVTNGFIQPAPLRELLPYLDALNIDIKGFSKQFYRRYVHGSIAPVLQTAEMALAAGCHLELTTLLVPDHNDDQNEIKELVSWIDHSLGKDVPLHFSRYYPHYKFKQEPTPLATMLCARSLAQEKLNYVYLGNVPELAGADTICPHCGQLVIQRRGWRVNITGLKGKQCTRCGRELAIVI
jgi:pyruvate formate lyase activating enzyme